MIHLVLALVLVQAPDSVNHTPVSRAVTVDSAASYYTRTRTDTVTKTVTDTVRLPAPPPIHDTVVVHDTVLVSAGGGGGNTVASCLGQPGPLLTLTGAQPATVKPYLANQKVNASAATWSGSGSYPVNVGAHTSPGLCWHGGVIDGKYAVSTTWALWHQYVAVFNHSPDAVYEHMRIRAYGDGFRMGDSASSWTVRDLVIEDAHDDCVENDRLEGGVIDRVWMSCFTFLSEQPGNKYPGQNGAGKTVAIRNSVIYEKPMPTTNNPPAPGTSFLFKWFTQNLVNGAKMTAVTVENTVFRLDQAPSTSSGKSNIPPELTCIGNNNWMVWRGSGAYPGTLGCLRLTNDVAVYDRAVAAWQAAHPGL